MRWRRFVVICLLLAAPLVRAAADAASVSARDPWIREPPPGTTTLAGYMELRNDTSVRQVLVGASSSGFETVMMHRSIVKGGIASMSHEEQVKLAPNASFVFAPGGYHLMLMSPKRKLHAGDRVPINLEFRSGLVLPVVFEVRK